MISVQTINELSVINFAFSQSVNYTFHRRDAKSYIDHILVSESLMTNVLDCKILTECPDNLSDHLPISCTLQLQIQNSPMSLPSPEVNSIQLRHFPRPKWNDKVTQEIYSQCLARQLCSIQPIDFSAYDSAAVANDTLNDFYLQISTSMHKAAQEATASSAQGTRSQHKKHWWNGDCTLARNRCRLFFKVWKDMGRPLNGAAYECYKDARRSYRRACRTASSSGLQKTYRTMDALYHTKCPGKFWNMVKRSKVSRAGFDAIGIETLTDHFTQKFSSAQLRNEFLKRAQEQVQAKHRSISSQYYDNEIVSVQHVKRIIRKLRLGCASGIDGITAEHLRYAVNTDLPIYLSSMLTLCLRTGCLPDAFRKGLLVPILKKPHLDATKPTNYRPITVSSITSKLLELYVMESSEQEFDPSQFGFVPHRGTTTAISLVHDVSSYCVSKGSPVYMCSLDAEGAFDAIPFPVIFLKASNVMPDPCWRIMHNWYSNMQVFVKWNGSLGPRIPVLKGTRQGGLSSPFLFNIFYKDLISSLSDATGGIMINGSMYNVFCYADDILLTSLTPTGLQRLIDISVSYITSHGLRFNPSKTNCMTFGRNNLTQQPTWTIESKKLSHVDELQYLGALLKYDSGASHVKKRIQSAQKAYYGLQGAGLCLKGLRPYVAARLYSVGVRTVLMYGCEAINLNKKSQKLLESTQGKLVKAFIGLRKTSYTTPIINALKIPSPSTSVPLSSLELLRSSIRHSSNATSFYSFLLSTPHNFNSLVNRCIQFIDGYDFNVFNFIFNDSLHNSFKKSIKLIDPNGVTDSIINLLQNFNETSRNLIQMLVNPF